MPRSIVNKHQYKTESLGGWIVSQLFQKKRKRKDLAEELSVSLQGLSWKLNHNCFNYSEMLLIFKFFESTDEEICYVMKF